MSPEFAHEELAGFPIKVLICKKRNVPPIIILIRADFFLNITMTSSKKVDRIIRIQGQKPFFFNFNIRFHFTLYDTVIKNFVKVVCNLFQTVL